MAGGPGESPARLDLKGTFSATGVSVRYVDLLPPAQGVDATASFTQDELALQLTRGASQGVRLDGGDVRLTGLAGSAPKLAVDVRLASTVPAVLGLAQSLPKDVRPSLPMPPSDTRGQVTARLKLDLPLVDPSRRSRSATTSRGRWTSSWSSTRCRAWICTTRR